MVGEAHKTPFLEIVSEIVPPYLLKQRNKTCFPRRKKREEKVLFYGFCTTVAIVSIYVNGTKKQG